MEELTIDELEEWPNCASIDCSYKVCLWTEEQKYCFKCEVQRKGLDELNRRYIETHI